MNKFMAPAHPVLVNHEGIVSYFSVLCFTPFENAIWVPFTNLR